MLSSEVVKKKNVICVPTQTVQCSILGSQRHAAKLHLAVQPSVPYIIQTDCCGFLFVCFCFFQYSFLTEWQTVRTYQCLIISRLAWRPHNKFTVFETALSHILSLTAWIIVKSEGYTFWYYLFVKGASEIQGRMGGNWLLCQLS